MMIDLGCDMCYNIPVMGASGFSQLITMEVSPTSSTSCSMGASGAMEQMGYKFEKGNYNHSFFSLNRTT